MVFLVSSTRNNVLQIPELVTQVYKIDINIDVSVVILRHIKQGSQAKCAHIQDVKIKNVLHQK